MALDVAQREFGNDLLVQNVDVMLERGIELPVWLDGTPVLVDMTLKQAHKGQHAIRHLQQLGRAPPEEVEEVDEEIQGILPGGERLLHAELSNFTPTAQQEPVVMHRDDKITEADLKEYMKLRGS